MKMNGECGFEFFGLKYMVDWVKLDCMNQVICQDGLITMSFGIN